MAKKTITLFDDTAPSGLTTVDELDLNAYESAVFYFDLTTKPAGNFTYNFYAREPVTETYTSVAGNILTANGTIRTEIPKLFEERYVLEMFAPAAGATVKAVIVVEDA
jgi:hypothetical protein